MLLPAGTAKSDDVEFIACTSEGYKLSVDNIAVVEAKAAAALNNILKSI